MATVLERQNARTTGPAVIFLPGVIAPAAVRYAPLIRELEGRVQAFTKDLELYGGATPADDYSIAAEVAGVVAAADSADIGSFYLYGHSAGGAVALAVAEHYPGRLLGLAVDEPASDFTVATTAAWEAALAPLAALPEDERMSAFMRAQVGPGVQLPPAPSGPPPEWMSSRPAGVRTFAAALGAYELPDGPSAFVGPVYYSFGSLTNPIWRDIRDRLASRFPRFTAEEYQGLHHLNTSYAVEPSRVAAALANVWNL